MLITVKNNGKGSQGIYAEGASAPVFLGPGRAKRFTVTEEEKLRIERIRTLAVVNHDDPRAQDPLESDGAKAITGDAPTLGTDSLDTTSNDGSEGGEPAGDVDHPVLDETEGGEGGKPWEAPAGKGGKKK